MAFFTSAVGVLKTLVIALGAGLGIWGVVNLREGYGNDNPGANAHVSKTRIASPATIPKSGERNRKIHSCMLYLISIWTYQADTAISLLAVNARLPIVRTKQE